MEGCNCKSTIAGECVMLRYGMAREEAQKEPCGCNCHNEWYCETGCNSGDPRICQRSRWIEDDEIGPYLDQCDCDDCHDPYGEGSDFDHDEFCDPNPIELFIDLDRFHQKII